MASCVTLRISVVPVLFLAWCPVRNIAGCETGRMLCSSLWARTTSSQSVSSAFVCGREQSGHKPKRQFPLVNVPLNELCFRRGSCQRRSLTTSSTRNENEGVCLVVPAENSNIDADVDVVAMAEEMSASLKIPLVVESPSVSTFHSPNAKSDEIGLSDFRHCLRFVPYNLDRVRSYAIAIQPIHSDTKHTAGKHRQNKATKKSQRRKQTMKPFFVDFCPPISSKLGRRFGQGMGGGPKLGSDLLLKAVSPQRFGYTNENNDRRGATVLDLTAGFGQDSVLIALGGASKVTMVEKNLIVATLLEDAMRRLDLIVKTNTRMDDDDDGAARMAEELSSKLQLHVGDCVSFAHSSGQTDEGQLQPDICYVDPMFPPRTKSAAVKKNMQILHGLLQSNENIDELRKEEEMSILEAAFSLARHRVVVKRPIQAMSLEGETQLRPTFSVRGSVNRWDVYDVNSKI